MSGLETLPPFGKWHIVVRGDHRAFAVFSADNAFRFVLGRTWNTKSAALHVVMLNPSTADERLVDPTVRKLLHFAQRDGFGGLVVANLFAIRAVHPVELLARREHNEAIDHPYNDAVMRTMMQLPVVTAAWGALQWKFARDRAAHIRAMRSDWRCFGTTKDGHPAHPCYLANKTPIVEWR